MRSTLVSMQEFRAAVHTADFWKALFRHALPVVGVAAFGWSAATIAIFFALESWIVLSIRCAIEITYDPTYASYSHGTQTRTRARTLLVLARNSVISAVGMGVLVLAFGGVVGLLAFSKEEGVRFVAHGWKQTPFLLSLVGLVAEALTDGLAFKRRLAHRTALVRAEDDAKTYRMFYRNTGLLFGAVAIMAMASAFNAGALAVVVAISTILMYFEVQTQRDLRRRALLALHSPEAERSRRPSDPSPTST